MSYRKVIGQRTFSAVSLQLQEKKIRQAGVSSCIKETLLTQVETGTNLFCDNCSQIAMV